LGWLVKTKIYKKSEFTALINKLVPTVDAVAVEGLVISMEKLASEVCRRLAGFENQNAHVNGHQQDAESGRRGEIVTKNCNDSTAALSTR
jgi:hypothetical protein